MKLRQKADLFNRLFSSDSAFTDKEIEKLLEKAREDDSMVCVFINGAHESCLLNINESLSLRLKYFNTLVQ